MNHFLNGFTSELVKVAIVDRAPGNQKPVPSPEFGKKLQAPSFNASPAPKPIASKTPTLIPKVTAGRGIPKKKENILQGGYKMLEGRKKQPHVLPTVTIRGGKGGKGGSVSVGKNNNGADELQDPYPRKAKKQVAKGVAPKRGFDPQSGRKLTSRQQKIVDSGGTQKQQRIRAERKESRLAKGGKPSGKRKPTAFEIASKKPTIGPGGKKGPSLASRGITSIEQADRKPKSGKAQTVHDRRVAHMKANNGTLEGFDPKKPRSMGGQDGTRRKSTGKPKQLSKAQIARENRNIMAGLNAPGGRVSGPSNEDKLEESSKRVAKRGKHKGGRS